MEEADTSLKKLTPANTKKEMLQAYGEVLKLLAEKEKAELQPQKAGEERRKAEAVKKADDLTLEGVGSALGSLKLETGKIMSQLSDKLEAEVQVYRNLQNAIAVKNQEVKELFDIERESLTLAALLETQKQKRREFEAQMAEEKETLAEEIRETRKVWDLEKKSHEAALKERDLKERMEREREREEYLYQIGREKKTDKDNYDDLKSKTEKDLAAMKEEAERRLAERERTVQEKEAELAGLKEQAARFPQEKEEAVTRAVQDALERSQALAQSRENLRMKEFEGEKNVMNTRIGLLEKSLTEQAAKVKELSGKLEEAYEKIERVAVKAIEGASQSKSFADLQKILSEKAVKTSADKEK